MVRVLPSLLFCLMALAVPARAADLATIGCVSDKLDAAVRDELAREVEVNLRETGKKHHYTPATLQAVKDATLACATENNWPEAANRPAMLYTMAKLAYPVAQRVATERGLDPAALEETWGTLPEERRNRPITPEVNRTLSEATRGGTDQSAEAAELVGEFFGYLSMMQFCSYDFSQA